jgi:hypothetical protein
MHRGRPPVTNGWSRRQGAPDDRGRTQSRPIVAPRDPAGGAHTPLGENTAAAASPANVQRTYGRRASARKSERPSDRFGTLSSPIGGRTPGWAELRRCLRRAKSTYASVQPRTGCRPQRAHDWDVAPKDSSPGRRSDDPVRGQALAGRERPGPAESSVDPLAPATLSPVTAPAAKSSSAQLACGVLERSPIKPCSSSDCHWALSHWYIKNRGTAFPSSSRPFGEPSRRSATERNAHDRRSEWPSERDESNVTLLVLPGGWLLWRQTTRPVPSVLASAWPREHSPRAVPACAPRLRGKRQRVAWHRAC